ncbi:unnamed protein product [Bathycoccus prasinos]
MMMREEEEESKEVRREKEEEEKEKKKSSVNDESHLKSNDNDESRQNDGDGSSGGIPESVLKEFEAFLKDNNDNSKNNNSITFSETQLSLPVRVLIHQMVKEKGKNMLGSRTISETNQIRAFRKKDYFNDNNKEGDESVEEDKEEEEQQRTRFERGNIELNDAFDFFLELKLKTKNGGRSSSSSLKINADVARSKYHKLSQRLHPSYNAASSGRKRGWCDQCGMLLELGRWYRFTTTTGSRSRSGEKDERDGGETADELTDICRVCLEKKKKKKMRTNFSTNKGRRDETENAYLEMEKNGELVLIKDLSAFGEKGSELREMYCCSLNDDESDDEREKSNNNNNNKKTILLTRAHKATLDFKKLTVAYLCFKDPSRTEIYKTFGFDQLKKHEENYSDVNIFECDPWEVYEDFFEGKDEDDRQYLLFNGVDLESSDSDLEEDMMVEEEAEEEKEEEEEDMDDDSEEDLNLLKQAKEMAKQQQQQQQQKKVIMSKSTSANEVLKFPFYQPGGVGGTHNRFVDNDDNEEDDEKKEDIWSTTISKAAV